MAQSEVRKNFIKHNPGRKLMGAPKGTFWYRCQCCGQWCGRYSGSGKNPIEESVRMEVDHIRPWSQGGSDELYNLQALCRTCNRSKSNNATIRDNIKTVRNTVMHPGDALAAPIRKAVRNNPVLKALGFKRK